MRIYSTLLVFLWITSLHGLSLVGLSGKPYSLDTITREGRSFIRPAQVCDFLRFSATTEQNSFTLVSQGDTLLVDGHSGVVSHTGDTLSRARVYVEDSLLFMEARSFFSLLTELTSFYFVFQKDTVLVSREPQLPFYDVSGVVVVDPGHGGRDPGAIGPQGTYEKDVVLSLSKALRDYIESVSHITVYLTREEDVFVPLMDRTAFANEKQADLFLSVHANAALDNKNARGYKLFFLAEAETEMERQVEERENAVIEYETTDANRGVIESILSDMMSTEYQKESQEFTIHSLETLDRSVQSVAPFGNGVGQANFFVLRGAEMPAVLVESAFISHPEEEKILRTSSFYEEFGSALGSAVVSFLEINGSFYE